MVGCILPLIGSSSIAIAFVGIIRLCSWNDKNRDDTRTILKRSCGAFLACMYGFGLAALWPLPNTSLALQLGIKSNGFLAAAFVPLFLTVILFLGSLVLEFIHGTTFDFTTHAWRQCLTDARWYRNLFLAPLAEEVAFNACALPLLLHCFSPNMVYFLGPISFSLAHFHHIPDLIRKGYTKAEALANCTFQAAYTYVFGVYSSFLFIRTGHIIAPIVCHSFCNHMGFPDFETVFDYDGWRRYLLIVCFAAGVLLWCIFLLPLTDPAFYGQSQFISMKL